MFVRRSCRLLRNGLKGKAYYWKGYGWGKCGNRMGPLRDIPDWSYADGTAAPMARKYRMHLEHLHLFRRRVIAAAIRSQTYLERGGRLPRMPGIRLNQKQDVILAMRTERAQEAIKYRREQEDRLRRRRILQIKGSHGKDLERRLKLWDDVVEKEGAEHLADQAKQTWVQPKML
eukprot:TRINITY_DN68155_c8_g6_i1.p1 TRINITY_DN68155_c8_g6~~TRINITY_DN68155_c8_g6_i1.p1  ORF type:complete len:174 (-),score=8.15 TRINITY_DN68155_c8_g6_i1:181-702(-)